MPLEQGEDSYEHLFDRVGEIPDGLGGCATLAGRFLPLSSRGLGRRPLTAETRARIPGAVLSVAPLIASLALTRALSAAMLYSVVTRKRRWPEFRQAWWYPDRGDDPGSGV